MYDNLQRQEGRWEADLPDRPIEEVDSELLDLTKKSLNNVVFVLKKLTDTGDAREWSYETSEDDDGLQYESWTGEVPSPYEGELRDVCIEVNETRRMRRYNIEARYLPESILRKKSDPDMISQRYWLLFKKSSDHVTGAYFLKLSTVNEYFPPTENGQPLNQDENDVLIESKFDSFIMGGQELTELNLLLNDTLRSLV